MSPTQRAMLAKLLRVGVLRYATLGSAKITAYRLMLRGFVDIPKDIRPTLVLLSSAGANVARSWE